MARTKKRTVAAETLLYDLEKLSLSELEELKWQIDQTLAAKTAGLGKPTRAEQGISSVEDAALWKSELGHYILQEADDRISIEEVRRALATIPGSMAAEVRAERDARG